MELPRLPDLFLSAPSVERLRPELTSGLASRLGTVLFVFTSPDLLFEPSFRGCAAGLRCPLSGLLRTSGLLAGAESFLLLFIVDFS